MTSRNEIVVLHCFSYVYDGGQETFIVKTFKYISDNSEKKFKYIVVSLVDANNPALEQRYSQNGIALFKLSFRNRNVGLSGIIHNVKQLFKLSAIIRSEKVDILYGHDFFSAFVTRLSYVLCLLQLYKVKKLYISIHNLLYWLKKPHNLINRILSLFTHKIVCVSKSVMDFSILHDKIKRSKYTVIYNGIDVNEFQYNESFRSELRKEYNIPADKFVIGAIGTISFRKGHHVLIKAFSKFRKKHENSMLVIFGGNRNVDGDEQVKNSIDELIKRLDLADSVKILKPRLDIAKAYSMFDIYTMPSVVEGFGLSLVEAMSSESLIIASDIPPFKEILNDDVTAFLFKSEDEDRLLDKLEMAFNLPDTEKTRMKQSARQYVIKNLSSEKMGRNFAALYENIYN